MVPNTGRSNLHVLDGANVIDIDIRTEQRAPLEVVAAVLEEMGREYDPMPYMVLVRTDPPLSRTAGGLFLTNTESSFWHGQGHAKLIKSTVVAAGAKSEKQVGDRICFQRLYFKWVHKLKDGTYFGAIAKHNIAGYIEDE